MINFQKLLVSASVGGAAALLVGLAYTGAWTQDAQSPETGPEIILEGIQSDDVSAGDADEIRRLAEGERALQALSAAGRVVFVGVEVLRQKGEDERTTVLYQATHYSYAANATIYTTVDLAGKKVLAVEEARNVPTPLSAEEFEDAKRLALADAAVREVLGGEPGRFTVEALALFTEDPRDPIFGHRTLSLYFRDGDMYIANVDVTVDLTAGTVAVTRNQPSREEQHQ